MLMVCISPAVCVGFNVVIIVCVICPAVHTGGSGPGRAVEGDVLAVLSGLWCAAVRAGGRDRRGRYNAS